VFTGEIFSIAIFRFTSTDVEELTVDALLVSLQAFFPHYIYVRVL